MIEAVARYNKYAKGLGNRAARVTVQLDPGASSPYVRANCDGAGWIAQGYIEKASAQGYDDWKAGAIAGATWALARCHRPECGVVITCIEGLSVTDTYPTVVGAATATAVWKALGHEPDVEAAQQLENMVVESMQPGGPRFDQQFSDDAGPT